MRPSNWTNSAKVEHLEPRTLLHVEAGTADGFGPLPPASAPPRAAIAAAAPNLRATDAFLTDSNFERLAGTPIEGQTYGIRINFVTESLPADAYYAVDYEVSGLLIQGVDRTFGAGEATGSWWVGRRYVFTRTGLHGISVRLDPANTVAESNEADNEIQFSFTPSPGTPPRSLAPPIQGAQGRDWVVTSYCDLDPRDNLFADYRGRGYTIDAHLGTDLAVADFAAMDRGVEVYAAAPGTVAEVHDGEFDRRDALLDPAPPANYVVVDHGGGWRTRYWHLRNGSVAVAPGQVVAAGQALGLVGSSGYSNGAHLHFALTYNGEWVEPFLDPGRYWQQAPAFAGGTPGAFAITPTDVRPPDPEWKQTIARRHDFHPGEQVWAATNFFGLNKEVIRGNRWFRPDGSQFASSLNAGAGDFGKSYRFVSITLPPDAPAGEWQVIFEAAGVERARASFLVAPRPGLPEIKVMDGPGYVIDGRTTPIDFGTIERGSGPAERTFTVQNYGTAPLTLTGVTLPPGFTTPLSWPITVPGRAGNGTAPGELALPVQLDDYLVGVKTGRVTLHSDDADEGEYDFAVTRAVTGLNTQVEDVFVNGTDWTADFRNHLQDLGKGSGLFGYATPDPAGAKAYPLPWINLNQVSVRFTDDARVDPDDLTLHGTRVDRYPRAGFSLDAVTRTATWTFAQDIVSDRLVVLLDASVTGLPFDRTLSVLPGDVTRDGIVLADDFSAVKKKFFSSPSSPGTGDAAYSVFHDVDGSGTILANDFSEVKKRFFNELPAAAPSTIQAARPAAFSDTPVASRTARPQRRGLLDEPEAGLLA
jgi:murein DD-endopeptidase MepM/ murein hydrolase activator NlpD